MAGELASIRAGKASPASCRLAGSVERLPWETKAELIETFIAQALQRVEAKQHCAPYLAALGLLGNRTPLYAGPETVLAAEFVVRAYAAFQKFDWAEPELMECWISSSRAARVVDDRNLDVPKSLRDQIVLKSSAPALRPTAPRRSEVSRPSEARTAPPSMASCRPRAWCSMPPRIEATTWGKLPQFQAGE